VHVSMHAWPATDQLHAACMSGCRSRLDDGGGVDELEKLLAELGLNEGVKSG